MKSFVSTQVGAWLAVLALLLTAPFSLNAQNVRLNEIMASNASTIADEDGDFEDWIELYNAGSEPVDLSGWGLSDNYDNPFKWSFPQDTTIGAGAHLLVWASGKDRQLWRNAGFWTLSEVVNDTVVDEWGGPRQATLQGDASFVAEAERDGAIDFMPSGSIELDEPVWLNGDFTVGYWFYTRRSSSWRAMNNASSLNFSIGHWTDSRISFWNPNVSIYPSEAFQTDTWEHITLTRSGSLVRIYRNGIEVGSGTWTGTLGIDHFGGVSGGTAWSGFDGMLGEVLMLPYAMDATEVGQLHAGTVTLRKPPLHTSYSISASGEEIILTMPDGTLVDELPPTPIPTDISIGRVEGEGDAWFYFGEPTPGATNSTTAYTEILEPPAFSHTGGFYDVPFALSLGADEEVTILYTLDGSEPDPAHLGGTTYEYKNWYPRNPGEEPSPDDLLERVIETHTYAEPLWIEDRSGAPNEISTINTAFSHATLLPSGTVFKGTTVRARAFREGALPSRTATQSYFVSPDMANRYDLLVVSFATGEPGLFGYDEGIYTAGQRADAWRLSNPASDFNNSVPANYRLRGREWERAANMEIFASDGTPLLNQGVGLRIHGGWSRAFRRKSFRIYARSEYDDRNAIEFDLFDGLQAVGVENQPVQSFRRLILRNSGNDWSRTLFRDAMIQDLVQHTGIPTQAYRPAIHFINGEYWGINNFRERMDQHYIESHFGIDPEDSVRLVRNAQIDFGTEADRQDYLDLRAFAETQDLTEPANYQHMVERVDVENLALYFAIQVYIRNHDWPQNNVAFFRKRTEGYLPDAPGAHDGRWRWLLFDTDHGFNYAQRNDNSLARVALPGGGPASWSTTPFRQLLANDDFRALFINTLADLMNTTFEPTRVVDTIDAFAENLASSRAEHVARWQNGHHTGTALRNFANARRPIVREHVLEVFDLPGTGEVTLHNLQPDGGSLRINTVTIDAETPGVPDLEAPYPWSGVYYQDVPIELEAVPNEGWQFAGWQIEPDGEPAFELSEALAQTTLAGDLSVTALFEPIPVPVELHVWDFEDAEELLAPSYTIGGGTLSTTLGSNTVVLANTGGDFDTQHLRINNPLGTELIFALPTPGFEAITLDFDTRRSGQGAGEQKLAYTTNGIDWIDYAEYAVFNDPPQSKSFDFSEVEGASDNPDFGVRIVFEQGDGATEGNNRFDDIVLSGLPLPGVNLPPEIVGSLADPLTGIEGGALVEIDLHTLFVDPDDDELFFDVEIEHAAIASATIEDGILRIAPTLRGETDVTVSATDGNFPPVPLEARLLVYPEAHPLAEGEYLFDAWSPDEPAGSFPPHMIFLQSDRSDTELDTELTFAYRIPPLDAAEEEDVALPYAATSRTRLNGLDADGLAFINTGRGRDLGGALLALDTRGVTEVPVEWLGGTILTNSRVYAIRLQYRVGHEGPFLDVLDEADAPVEYMRNAENGHTAQLEALLPAEALDEPYVQLLWRYYRISGTSGPRAQLRLDDIRVGEEPTGFRLWQVLNFSAAELDDPGVSGPLADPDESGLPNLLRYALGLSRHEAFEEHQPWPWHGLGDDGVEIYYVYRRLIDPDAGVEYRVEISDDLFDPDGWELAEIGVHIRDAGTVFPTGDGITEEVALVMLTDLMAQVRAVRLRVVLVEE